MSEPSEQQPLPASESSVVNSALPDSGDEKGKRGNYNLIRGYEARQELKKQNKSNKNNNAKKTNDNSANTEPSKKRSADDETQSIAVENGESDSTTNNNNSNSGQSGNKKQRREREIETHQRQPNPERNRQYPKKRIVLLFCYCGANYVGLQRNPGVHTVELVLEKALVEKGAISAENAGSFNKIGWSSAARTDKGVSALGNVVAFKALMIPNLIEEVNSVLPEDIRLLEYKLASKSFNCKTNCFGRLYYYICPTYIFAPSKFHEEYQPNQEFKFTPEVREKINKALAIYLGTNKYHNFTERINFEDAQSQRLMLDLECSEPFEQDGMEFVQIAIRGQSFVLHQIRNMVALVFDIIRDGKPRNVINACFTAPRKKWPMAPAEGLFLGRTFYDIYNNHVTKDKKLTWEDSLEKMEKFKRDVILPHIAIKCRDKVFEQWLEYVDAHPLNYEYLLCTTPYEIATKFPDLANANPEPEPVKNEERMDED